MPKTSVAAPNRPFQANDDTGLEYTQHGATYRLSDATTITSPQLEALRLEVHHGEVDRLRLTGGSHCLRATVANVLSNDGVSVLGVVGTRLHQCRTCPLWGSRPLTILLAEEADSLPALVRNLADVGWGPLGWPAQRGPAWVLSTLSRVLDPLSGVGSVAARELGARAGYSERWVRHSLKRLQDLGLIEWHRGTGNRGGNPSRSEVRVNMPALRALVRGGC